VSFLRQGYSWGGCSCWDSMLIGNARSSGLPCPCNVWGCCFDGGRMGGVSSFGRRRCPAIVVVDFSPRLSKLPRPPDTGFRAAQRWGRCSLIRHNRGGRPTPSSRPGGVVEAASSHGRSAIAMVPLVHRGARSRILQSITGRQASGCGTHSAYLEAVSHSYLSTCANSPFVPVCHLATLRMLSRVTSPDRLFETGLSLRSTR